MKRGNVARKFGRKHALAAISLAALAATSNPALAASKFWVGPWGTWSHGTNWSPSGMPQPGDAVNIGDAVSTNNLQVFLDVNPSVASLTLFNGIWMDNKQHPITVAGTTTIAGFVDNWSRLWLRNAVNPYDLHTGNLTLTGGSSIFAVDNPTIYVTGTMNLHADTSLIGSAVINFTGDDNPVMVLDGRWSSDAVSSLTLNQLGTGKIDLDGGTIMDNFLLIAGTSGGVYQTLTINGTSLTDDFDDIFWVSNGNTLNMNLSDGWALGANGKIWLRDSGKTESAKINGGTLTVNGTIEFETGLGDIWQMLADVNAPTIFNFSSDVIVGGYDHLNINGPSTVNAGSFALVGNGNNRLKFNGATKLLGGTFTTTSTNSEVQFNGPTQYAGTINVNGTAVQNGTATISATTVINADRFDMDGDNQLTTWKINAPLTINADDLDFSDNLMSGTIDVTSSFMFPASLTVNLPANESWTAGGLVKLTGSGFGVSTTLAGSDVGFGGGLTVTNANAITARADFLLGSLTTINSNSALHLLGGSIADPNTIDGATMLGVGTLAAPAGKALVGYGNINNPIDFDGTAELRAKGGKLKLTGSILDVGVIGTGDSTGILEITQPWNSSVADKVELKGGQIIGATLTNNNYVTGNGTLAMSHINNNGGLTASGGTLTINTPSPTGADLDGSTEAGQLIAVNGSIRVFDSSVEVFNGTAQVGPARTLRFENGWTNGGTTTLTGSPGTPATLSSGATQHLGGTLIVNGQGRFIGATALGGASKVNLDLGGTDPGVEFDQITATSTVTINGKLSLTVTGGYDPAYGVPHEIMSMGARNNTFATIDGVALSSSKYLAVTYDPNSVFVQAALPGDANLNGTVNLDDFNVLATNFGTSGHIWISGDFTGNGAVDLDDFNALASNFGISAGAAGVTPEDWAALTASVPEPSLGVACFGFAGAFLARRRRISLSNA